MYKLNASDEISSTSSTRNRTYGGFDLNPATAEPHYNGHLGDGR